MKKIITSMMLFAVAAMAFVSCQKNEVAPKYEQTTLTFTSANPNTRTEWNSETIVWSAGDKIRMALTIGNSWYTDANGKVKYYVSKEADLSDGSQTAKFEISSSFDTELSGNYQFYALYPSSCTGTSTDFTNAPNATYTIASEQIASSQTFDKSSDILWGKAVNTYTSLPEGERISLMWNRLVAHAYITLKGLPAGETINKVTLTAQEGAALVGKYNVDITTGAVSENTPANSVLVNCEGVIVGQDGTATFWACINPCNVTSLNIVVDTDKAVYSIDKTNLDLDFLVNRRNVQPVNMSGAERVEKAAAEDYSGTYAILAVKSGVYYYLTNVDDGASTKRLKSQEVDALPAEGAGLPASYVWNVISNEDGTYLLQSAENNYYLDHNVKSSNSCVLEESKEGVVSLTIEKSDDRYLVYYYNGTDKRILQKANNSSYNYFAFYTTDQCGALYLIPAEVSVVPSIEIAETEVAVDAAAGSGSFSYSVVNPRPSQNVTATANVNWISNIVVGASSVSYSVAENTLEEAREGVITLSYEGAEDVVVTISQAAKAASGASYYVKVTSAPADWSGKYLLVCENKNEVFAGIDGNYGANEVVTISNGKIASNNAVDAYQIQISKSGSHYLIAYGSKYLAYKSSTYVTLVTSVDDKAKWTISGNGNVTITNVGQADRTIYWSTTSTGCFAAYTSKGSSQQYIQLYRLED